MATGGNFFMSRVLKITLFQLDFVVYTVEKHKIIVKYFQFKYNLFIIDGVKFTLYLYSNISETYWTSDVIFCLVYHLKSLHFSIILQMKHKTYFLSLFAAWETYQKFKNLNIVLTKWKGILISFERVLCTVTYKTFSS